MAYDYLINKHGTATKPFTAPALDTRLRGYDDAESKLGKYDKYGKDGKHHNTQTRHSRAGGNPSYYQPCSQ